MKKNLLFFWVLLLLLITISQSCKKNKPTSSNGYAKIKMADIQAKETALTTNKIAASGNSGVIWQAGDVYIFKPNENRYGKFQVVNINTASNYDLTIKATVYNTNGTEKLSANALVIHGTWLCDLDLLTETNISLSSDFFWQRLNNTDTEFTPQNGAKFVKYIF